MDTDRSGAQTTPCEPYTVGSTEDMEKWFDASIVNYADDFVICCRNRAEEALQAAEAILTRMQLTLNPRKTRISRLPEGSFDFLGYTFGRCYAVGTGRPYIGTRVSKKAIAKLCDQAGRALKAGTKNKSDRFCWSCRFQCAQSFDELFCFETDLDPGRKADGSFRDVLKVAVAEAIDDKWQIASSPGGRSKRPP